MSTDAQTIARPWAARRHAARRHERRPVQDRGDVWLLRAVDAGLASTICVVPLVMGGRQAAGQLVLIGLAVWTAGCWCLRQARSPQATWTRSSAEPLLLAAIFLVSLQLMALPPAVLTVLSSRLYPMLPLWAPQADSAAPA